MREYLKTMRKAAGLSQTQVAEKLDITQTGYSYIESGRKRLLNPTLLNDLADILGVESEHIISEEVKYENAQQNKAGIIL